MMAIDPEAYRLVRGGRWADALPLAMRAVAGGRVCLTGHSFLISILLKLGRIAEAESVVDEALGLATGSAEAYDGLAYVSSQLGRHASANAIYRRAVSLAPRRARGWYHLACSERSFGRLADAEAACERAIALDGKEYPSFLLRSELGVQTAAANHITDLEKRLADPHLDKDGRIFLGYALGKELDDVQRYDEAFACFRRAAQARRTQIRYDVAGDEQRLQRIAQVFSNDWLHHTKSTYQGADSSVARHFFIVGLPRSGTTLVERIVTGLAGVRSNGETDNFSRALTAAVAAAPADPAASAARGDMVERAAAADPAAVAAHYEQLAGAIAAGQTLVDKLPTNYLYLGAIRRSLPHAGILSVRRSPLDSCFAMYRTVFGNAYPFSYDFEELARYFAAYEALMDHWRNLFGDAIHDVVYEDLVREPQRVGASMARYGGLDWRAEATDIQTNRSVSLTASSAQIRRPIYGSSSGRWRHYQAHLTPLILALRRRGVALPADACG